MSEPLILSPSRQPAAANHSDVEVLPSSAHSSVSLAWHRSAVLLSSSGLSLYEISRSLNRPVREIQNYLTSPEARQLLSEASVDRVAGTYESSQLHSAAQDAVLVLQTLMHSAASEPVRLQAAKEILDRTLGRPSQNVVHTSKPKQKEEDEIESLRKELGMSAK
jgi:hypothetical protein